MRRLLILVLLTFGPWAHGAEGRVIKVLPQFLDKKGETSLSPSLYERDAYQFYLRIHPRERTALRLAVQWKAKGVGAGDLKLRAELRGLESNTLHTISIEQPVKKKGHFSEWSSIKVAGQDYKNLGPLVAWRVSLWEGDHQLGALESFLWSPVSPSP
ncbi:MAG: hypothetical protein ACLQVY_19940 [Limisphaerales bacterium]